MSGSEQVQPVPTAYDPDHDVLKTSQHIDKCLDLPPEAYLKTQGRTPFARRPGFNSSAKPINVQVNQFRVASIGNADVFQFDVSVTPEPPRPHLIAKIWQTATVQAKLMEHGKPWIYDGRNLAWSTNRVDELSILADLDEGQRKSSKANFQYTLLVRNTGTIRLQALRAYLEGKMDWNNSVLECMNFLDHVMRQGPSQRMRAIRRNFFPLDAKRMDLNKVTEVIKGMYASMRMNQSIQQGGTGLGVNVSVSNSTFFLAQPFEQLVREFIGCYDRKWENMQYNKLADELCPQVVRDSSGGMTFTMSEAFRVLRKLQRIRFKVYHRGKTNDDTEYVVKSFVWSPSYGKEGANAKNIMFDKKEDDGTVRKISVFDYFQERYQIHLKNWRLPLIETARGGYFPMEVCIVPRYNRYPFKLDPVQTQQMIKFAVQRPAQQRQDIMANVQALGWNQDKYLQEFGIKINPTMPIVQARLITNPEVQFGNGKLNPGFTGRWDLRGRKFVSPNAQPLKSWAFVAVDMCVDERHLQAFVNTFCQTYQSHGGRIAEKPLMFFSPSKRQHHDVVKQYYEETSQKRGAPAQIIFFILKDKTAWVYERMKKNADCRWACLTQMLQAAKVCQAQAQYCSNVSMKVNAKLEGQTSRIPSAGPSSPFFKVPTIMIGVDVSHASPGSPNASMAAMCVSMDRDAATYVAACETNGHRVEILTPGNTRSMLPNLILMWCRKHRVAPQHAFYFRDGVSEGQFAHVMEYEVEEVRKAFKEVTKAVPKITVIVATKRHHIRIFPEKGDKNGNPLPGTLVEREVTHPYHYDFYLCSHVAIQGTARPVHYHVIHDEIGMKPDELQTMIYHQCYQYVRSTTPVSLHPAVYYAHLASARARAHENIATSDQVPSTAKSQVVGKGPGLMAKRPDSSSTSSRINRAESIPLLPMGSSEAHPAAVQAFRRTMWFI
ncbi:hypothetical protein VTK73DRAFT_6839 [Phialemonium thermophilum]|uniref:Uncharacterized protein n=1 Tax=Phialemonium thermophilum TaxID=223376 RepID=A0ABR3Y785_9PEZI